MSTDLSDAPFSICVEGETTGETVKGEFRAKTRLSHKDSLIKDKIRRELLGPDSEHASDRAKSVAMIVSELTVRITKAPKWWADCENGLNLEDDNVLGVIFDSSMKIETEALATKRKAAEEAQEALKKVDELK